MGRGEARLAVVVVVENVESRGVLSVPGVGGPIAAATALPRAPAQPIVQPRRLSPASLLRMAQGPNTCPWPQNSFLFSKRTMGAKLWRLVQALPPTHPRGRASVRADEAAQEAVKIVCFHAGRLKAFDTDDTTASTLGGGGVLTWVRYRRHQSSSLFHVRHHLQCRPGAGAISNASERITGPVGR